MHSRIGWGQPPPGWAQPHLPGWAPLVDLGPTPLHAARSLRHWWWPTATVAGFLAVVAQVLGHDDPAPGLSAPGLLTIVLAAAVVALLTIHRRNGPRWLTRAVAEYAVVALLATLLAAPGVGVDQRPPDHAKPTNAGTAAGDDQPAVIRAGAKVVGAVTRAASALGNAVRWLVDLWRQASQKAALANGEAMAAPLPSVSLSAPSSGRFGS